MLAVAIVVEFKTTDVVPDVNPFPKITVQVPLYEGRVFVSVPVEDDEAAIWGYRNPL